ncbi:oocyte zinc finger protein XlCOF6.1 [Exaiptasia diaphana]|uniref:C2H2-type domain-containing protein n=1 Tax=Exaiptasia diaphana TaxID=2652724 RepID=A0A913XA64_EXADI|nr:oocyte zinc finger protein XlCOF6.1 [Exaiptasia diaphana]KXJ13663.1 Zinc finger protein 1-like [Exaiptasia diaphana]
MDSNWIEYKCNSGLTLFIYNKVTGEHKWPAKDKGSLKDSIAHGKPILNKEFCSIATQTDDYGCDNGCSSIYTDRGQDHVVMSDPKPEQVAAIDDKSGQDDRSSEDTILDTADRDSQSIEVVLNPHADTNCGQQNVMMLEYEQEVPSMVRVYSEGIIVLNPDNASPEKDKDVNDSSVAESNNKKDVEIHVREGNSSQQALDSLTCSYCAKKFNCKSKLVCHLRSHTGEKPFECPYCSKRFKRKHNLNSHLMQHSGDQPFQCSYCEKRFSHKSSWSYHLRTHAEEKPFECTQCEKKFVRQCDLNMHIKTHLGEKPFQCSLCQKTFLRKDHLKDHLRTHAGKKPFECPYCHKTFGQKGTLSYHIKTHTGEKPFQCSICTKKFIHRGHLNVHLQMHSGERQFECQLCQMKFSREGRLNYHLKTHGDQKAF